MKRKMTRLAMLLGVLVMLAPVLVALAQGPDVEILMPVTGRLLFSRGQTLYQLDTTTGDISTVTEESSLVDHLLWAPEGDRVTYLSELSQLQIFNLETGQADVYPSDRYGFFVPWGWSSNTDNILYGYFEAVTIDPGESSIELFTPATGSLETLAQATDGTPITDFPIPSDIEQVNFVNFNRISRNPVFDEWLLLQIHGENPAEITTDLYGSTFAESVYITVLWNYEIDQIIALDALLPRHN
jgi:hypothetical protein